MNNPFGTCSEFFGREKEMTLLNQCIENGKNVVILAPYGSGKTALFTHCCQKYKYSKRYKVIHCDLAITQNTREFCESLIRSLSPHVTELEHIGLQKWVQSLKLVGGVEPVSGKLTWELGFNAPKDASITLEKIRELMVSSGEKYIIFFDEFHRVLQYPDNNAEGVLYAFINSIPNLVCVFSGSHNRMVKAMFKSKNHPFYMSARTIDLDPLDRSGYASYVSGLFKKNKVLIDIDLVEDVYDQFEGSTLYLQSFFSYLFSSSERKDVITLEKLHSSISSFVSEFSNWGDYFMSFTDMQQDFLISLANEKIPIIYKRGRPTHAPNSVSSLLVRKEIISRKNLLYYFNDKVFRLWIRSEYPI